MKVAGARYDNYANHFPERDHPPKKYILLQITYIGCATGHLAKTDLNGKG